jgi:hypothetical protein
VLCGGDYCRYARMLGVTLGPGCRILDVPEKVFGSEPFLVTLGKHVSITARTRAARGSVQTFREEVAPRTVRVRSLPFVQKKEAILARFTE